MCLGLFHCASHRVWSSTESYLYKMGTQLSQAGHKRTTPYNSFPVPVTTITMVATAHVPPPINPNPLPAGPPKFGRTALAGMGIAGLCLAGFYMNLNRMQQKRELTGQTPSWENRLKDVNYRSHPEVVEDLQSPAKAATAQHKSTPIRAEPSYTLTASSVPSRYEPAKKPIHEHDHHHRTLEDHYKLEGGDKAIRRQVPSPQRSHNDGSGIMYTKRPPSSPSF